MLFTRDILSLVLGAHIWFSSSLGTSSVSQRDEPPAFSSQFDGMDVYFFFFFAPVRFGYVAGCHYGCGLYGPAHSESAKLLNWSTVSRRSCLSLTVTCLLSKRKHRPSPYIDNTATEVDRAIDNLVKSGKLWAAPRRDSMPMMMNRPYPDYGMEPRNYVP